jgi:hypothetical protein
VGEHGSKQLSALKDIGVEGLVTADSDQEQLKLFGGLDGIIRVILLQYLARNAVDSHVHIHFLVLAIFGGAQEALRLSLCDKMRAQPDGIASVHLVREVEGFLELIHGDQKVLNNVFLLVVFSDKFALSELEEGDLWWHKPSQKVAEDGVVSPGEDELSFPEDAARVAVVVVAKGDVLDGALIVEAELFCVFVEPRV